jgi:UDP-glucose 6-dehydrogenase
MAACAGCCGHKALGQTPKDRPSIGIVGCGFVGQSLLQLFGPCEVYDPAQGKTDKDAINRCRFAFVCVPTPTGQGGECDVSLVEETVRWIESDVIVIRSTVAPGTTDRLRHETGKHIIFQPEYIGETVAHPLLDHQAQGFSVLGGAIEDTSSVADLYKRYYHAAHRFYFCPIRLVRVVKLIQEP